MLFTILRNVFSFFLTKIFNTFPLEVFDMKSGPSWRIVCLLHRKCHKFTYGFKKQF